MQYCVVKHSGRKYYPFYYEEKTEDSINPLKNNSFSELQKYNSFSKNNTKKI